MSKQHHQPGAVPQGNRPRKGPGGKQDESDEIVPEGAPFNDQDPKRRLGGFTGAGEHAIQQPDGKQGSK